MRKETLIILTLCLAATPAAAQTRVSEHTYTLDSGAVRPKVPLAALAWMTGHWVDSSEAGFDEEMWGEPRFGQMVGLYRMVQGGKPRFSEHFMIVETDSTLALRLKHFRPDLVGWEHKDSSLTFPLVFADSTGVYFEALSYIRQGDTAMSVYVRMRQTDGSHSELGFEFKRRQ